MVADVWACCGGQGLGEFSDIDDLTAFADYRIPQSLVWMGVLEYSESLLKTLKSSKLQLFIIEIARKVHQDLKIYQQK